MRKLIAFIDPVRQSADASIQTGLLISEAHQNIFGFFCIEIALEPTRSVDVDQSPDAAFAAVGAAALVAVFTAAFALDCVAGDPEHCDPESFIRQDLIQVLHFRIELRFTCKSCRKHIACFQPRQSRRAVSYNQIFRHIYSYASVLLYPVSPGVRMFY